MYNNYEGNYLEGFILQAKNFMLKSKKYQNFRLRLLGYHDIKSFMPALKESLDILKQENFYHYKSSRKYTNLNNAADILDKCLATDDILFNEETDHTIAIDWTSNIYAIQDKVEKHLLLKSCIENIADFQIVVCMQNVDLWEGLNESDLAKSLYKVLQKINDEVLQKDYSGFIIIDVKSII